MNKRISILMLATLALAACGGGGGDGDEINQRTYTGEEAAVMAMDPLCTAEKKVGYGSHTVNGPADDRGFSPVTLTCFNGQKFSSDPAWINFNTTYDKVVDSTRTWPK